MKHRVSRKQPNSRMCLVCGHQNPYGLFTAFYELDNGELAALFTARDEHQGYPGRLHGGLITALLDETIGRAIRIRGLHGLQGGDGEEVWGVTLEFNARFLKPVPLGVGLRVVARIVKEEGRRFEGTAEILLPDGQVAATGSGKYLRLPLDRIAAAGTDTLDWKVTQLPDDPHEIEVNGPDLGQPGPFESV